MTHLKTPIITFAALFVLALLLIPMQSFAGCKGDLKVVNYANHALIVKGISLDLKRDKGKAWVDAYIYDFTLEKGETKTITYEQELITNCGRANKAFRLKYYAQRGTNTAHYSSTNYKRGNNFTITRTGRTSFELSKGTN